MIYIAKQLVKVTASLALVVALLGGTTVKVNAASTASKKINNTYGKITGSVEGSIFCGAKNINTSANSTKKVPRLMANVEVQYYKTGKTINYGGTSWMQDVKYAGADVDMIHFKNALKNNKYDGFLNTKLTAYGCAEAIVKKAYTVYTSCVY